MYIIKILVAQKNLSDAEIICSTLIKMGHQVLEPATNYTDAMKLIEAHAPDIAILDVVLTGKLNGIDFAKEIKNIEIPFIFLASNVNQDTLRRIKKLAPNAFLQHPFSSGELQFAVESAYQKHLFEKLEKQREKELEKESNYLFIRDKNAFKKLLFNDILYLKSDNNYVDIYTKNNGHFVVREGLKNYIKKLGANFIRTHRSYVVNIANVDCIKRNSLIIGAQDIPISRSYKKYVDAHFRNN